MKQIILLAHNLRSCHNVGSLFRTADGLGVTKIYLTGYTPYPTTSTDTRLPHVADKLHRQIQKTALGAETTVDWQHNADVNDVIRNLRKDGFTIAALEQSIDSDNLLTYHPPAKIALIVGRETDGIEPEILAVCDLTLEIPMLGKKESFNVVQAATIALYHCMYYNRTHG